VPNGFLNKLGEMYTGERELVLALPLLVTAAKSKDLKTLLRVHLKETKGHVKTLREIAESLGQKLPMKRCPTITKLIAEGTKAIAKRLVSSNEDAALIAVGRKIEQFEIDSYGPLCATAEENDFTHERASLASILTQEELAHELLGAVGAGKGPLDELVRKASLERARGQ
jgi:ferritin-like metal-binding protein YciE